MTSDVHLFQLRIIALSSPDPVRVSNALGELGETADEAAEQLAGTCWTEDLPRPWTARRITAHVRQIVKDEGRQV